VYEIYVRLRDERSLSDYRVSEDTEITKSTFSDWKSGRSKPKVDKLQVLANYFDVPLAYFLVSEEKEVG